MEKIICDNYYDNRDNYRDYAIMNILDMELYEKEEYIPEEKIDEEIDNMFDSDFDSFKYDFENFIKTRTLLATGYIGTWHGNCKGGKVINSFNDLYDLWKDCDYIKVYEENGLLCLKCSHHDGTNYIEFRELTEKGKEFLDNTYLDREQAHDKVLATKSYWKLPRFMKVVYGA